jgi:hypothetical protein
MAPDNCHRLIAALRSPVGIALLTDVKMNEFVKRIQENGWGKIS